MGNAEDAVRRRIAIEQQDAAAQERAIERNRIATKAELVGQIDAAAKAAIQRLEQQGYPGGEIAKTQKTSFFSIQKELACWKVFAGTATLRGDDVSIFFVLVSDGTIHRRGSDGTIAENYEPDIMSVENLVCLRDSLRNLGG